jgi:hypothetical protein
MSVIEEQNIYETHINKSIPSNNYVFSPKISKKFNEMTQNMINLPKYTLAYIGNDSYSSAVYFYKCSTDTIYVFLMSSDGITDYYLL